MMKKKNLQFLPPVLLTSWTLLGPLGSTIGTISMHQVQTVSGAIFVPICLFSFLMCIVNFSRFFWSFCKGELRKTRNVRNRIEYSTRIIRISVFARRWRCESMRSKSSPTSRVWVIVFATSRGRNYKPQSSTQLIGPATHWAILQEQMIACGLLFNILISSSSATSNIDFGCRSCSNLSRTLNRKKEQCIKITTPLFNVVCSTANYGMF